MRSPSRHLARLCGLACLLAALGCGGGGGPKLYPVKGRVLLGKAPIAVKEGESALVEYYADKSAGNNETAIPRAEVGPDGTYELATNGKPGAPAGAWLVTVLYQVGPGPNAKDEAAYAVPKPLIHEKFGSSTTSPLKREVKPDGGDYDLAVTK